ncbi:uncharacterized protein LAESUDRAFT_681177 [Laetiporus sulphureus 93-53]|uniref:Mitochondrial distribution and morphology protein 34 n=1 Tax=Laetiporus sulphureus 93-53 TaxID=1314785 RepID=A0A165DTZ9_9APHY|nr:uncharacterized protein LAESUDRAFT_681177 [Laetiporus sulphureus 93-53]KZT05629.1 hypothetical protein LAESUDRAFT_681177 [Laetiporus sulphureus 93-53]
MSFTFKWPRFSDQFHADAIQLLTSALNKGNKPPVIADKIEVVELEMGTQPPELEIRDIGELTMDQFRGIFRLTYSGDAHIVLRTKVQANPLNHKQPDILLMGGSRGMLAAKQPLVVPMLLRLSHFKLNSYVVLVVSRQKGITLVFKTDPLQNVDINSTFDSIAVIQKFIQHEIEGQLRQMFREDLPGIIHRLSQQWVKAKVETPLSTKRPSTSSRLRTFDSMSASELSVYRPSQMQPMGLPPGLALRQPYGLASVSRARTASVFSCSSAGRRASSTASSPPSTVATPAPEDTTSFPDLENYDPTYGLRPEGLPAKSVFSGFRSLFAPSKGLAVLSEEANDMADSLEDAASYSSSNWDELFSDYNSPPSVSAADDETEYETVPAVGGGTITRPRVYHSQSQILPSVDGSPVAESSTAARSRGPTSSPRSSTARGSLLQPSHPWSQPINRHPSYNPYLAGMTPFHDDTRSNASVAMNSSWHEESMQQGRSSSDLPPVPPLYRSPPPRVGSPSSLRSGPSRSSDMTHSVPTPPTSDEEMGIQVSDSRRLSLASSNLDRFQPGSPSDQHYMPDHDPKIILRAAANSSISKLSTLSHSNHTLSPYTRTLEHFTVRSVPPRRSTSSGTASSVEKQPVKARRKRTYYLGGKPAKPPESPGNIAPRSPPPTTSEFDASEMDRYFRSNDDLIPPYPDHISSSSNARRRVPYQAS